MSGGHQTETKQVGAKELGLRLLHLMSCGRILRRSGIYFEFHFRMLNYWEKDIY